MGVLSPADKHGTRLNRYKFGRLAGGFREEGGKAELSLYLFGPDGRLARGTLRKSFQKCLESYFVPAADG